jgi:hypothetical protein
MVNRKGRDGAKWAEEKKMLHIPSVNKAVLDRRV